MPTLMCSGMQLAALTVVFCIFMVGLPVLEAQEKNPDPEPSDKKPPSSTWTGFQIGGQPMIGHGILPIKRTRSLVHYRL
ncbi:MAG: hypothetical protein KDA51_17130 [Planctomycetales bacterium]|nr:hypothetical protein [Planctomycetales bacterium]MCA9183191.1 hypothetical protein [Planctomycetales bacterium]